MNKNSAQGLIVTGGSRGIGLALVENLLAEGCRVATCSRKSSPALDKLMVERKTDLAWFPCTIGNEKSEQKFFDDATRWLDKTPLWGLVNNAAIAGEGVLATYPTVDIERILNINLLGVIRLSRLALRQMLKKEGEGRIINISSIVGQRGYTGLTAYAASKAGLDGLTRALAREVGRRGITINSVAPGYVTTELSASLTPRQRDQIINRTPLGRLAEPSDIVPVVTFLLSTAAGFITGQTITVDGGLSN
jgi:3-oxoacyl-[acyl-carrier protein] reductase